MSETLKIGFNHVKLIPGELRSGLRLKFDCHGFLIGFITWYGSDENNFFFASLPINLNKNFDTTLCCILKVLLGNEVFSFAVYESNANLNDILKPGLEATAIFVDGQLKGFGHNGQYAIINCDYVIESKEDLIRELAEY